MTDGAAPEPSLFPPDWYVDSFNANALVNGWPMRTALDPLLMMAWHLASAPPPQSFCLGLPAL